MQGRWVSYIYRYRNDVRCENAGFIKVQMITCRADREARIQIGLKLYKKKACKCRAYLLYDKNRAKPLTDIFFAPEERDTIMKRVEVPWENPLHDGMSIEKYDGLLFLCDDGEALTGMWNEYPVVPSKVMLEELSAEEPEMQTTASLIKSESRREEVRDSDAENGQQEQASEGLKTASAGMMRQEEPEKQPENQTTASLMKPECKREEGVKPEADVKPEEDVKSEADVKPEAESGQREQAAESQDTAPAGTEDDICQVLLHTYPRLPLFADSQLIECVKIVPQDIGRLAMSNWKLAVNSFLSHGFYHYRYLMFGRVKLDETESFVIGVPGVFTNKEKYLANMFGFHIFIPVKKAKVLTGNFGYWISEVASE